jgi:hypothetical protein
LPPAVLNRVTRRAAALVLDAVKKAGVLGSHIHSAAHQVAIDIKLGQDPERSFDNACETFLDKDQISWKVGNGNSNKIKAFGS